MDTGRAALPHRPQARDRGPAVEVGVDAAHVVVGGRGNRQQVLGWVESHRHRMGIDRGEAIREVDDGAGIEIRTLALVVLPVDGAGDDVPWRQLGHGMVLVHESPAVSVDQECPVAPQRLGEERHRVLPGMECGGMELHEFQIGEPGPRPPRHGDAIPGHAGWVGGPRVEPSRPTGGQDDRRGQEHMTVLAVCGDHAGDSITDHGEVDDPLLQRDDPVSGFDRSGQCPHDFSTGGIAVGVDHATNLMAAFPTELQLTVLVTVELGAQLDERGDRGRARVGQDLYHPFDAETPADTQGVIRMLARRVLPGQGDCDPSLGPPGGSHLRRRDDVGPGQAEGDGETGDSSTNHDRGVETRYLGHGRASVLAADFEHSHHREAGSLRDRRIDLHLMGHGLQ